MLYPLSYEGLVEDYQRIGLRETSHRGGAAGSVRSSPLRGVLRRAPRGLRCVMRAAPP